MLQLSQRAVTKNKFITVAPDYRLAITEHYNPTAKITGVILHGFQSSRQGNGAITAMDALATVGMNAIALDFHAHGNSDGEFKDLSIARSVENVKAVIDYIHARDPQQKIILIGASFGGLVAQYAAIPCAQHVIAVILRAPVSDWWAIWQQHLTPEIIKSWRETGGHAVEIIPGLPITLGLQMLDDIQRQDIYSAIAPCIMVPVLIVHGTADDIVSFDQSLKLQDALPNSTLVTLPDGDHRFSNPDDLQAYKGEIEKFLQTL
jgi:pimeloyl-ACP methyl ester carboxylesterase